MTDLSWGETSRIRPEPGAVRRVVGRPGFCHRFTTASQQHDPKAINVGKPNRTTARLAVWPDEIKGHARTWNDQHISTNMCPAGGHWGFEATKRRELSSDPRAAAHRRHPWRRRPLCLGPRGGRMVRGRFWRGIDEEGEDGFQV